MVGTKSSSEVSGGGGNNFFSVVCRSWLVVVLNILTSISYQPTATMIHIGNSAFVPTYSPSSSWVIDSGASSHMSGINSLFHNHYLIKHNIVLADGSTRLVLGKCVIHPIQSLSLFDSLYMPSFPFNLLFVSQLTKSFQYSIILSPNFYVFRISG